MDIGPRCRFPIAGKSIVATLTYQRLDAAQKADSGTSDAGVETPMLGPPAYLTATADGPAVPLLL